MNRIRLSVLLALGTATLLCSVVALAAIQDEPTTPEPSVSGASADGLAASPRPIAVLPFTNRSATGSPSKKLRDSLIQQLMLRGLQLLARLGIAEIIVIEGIVGL